MANYTSTGSLLQAVESSTGTSDIMSSLVTMISKNAPKVYQNVVFHRIFNIYLMFPILVVGLIGNVLVVAVMRDKVFNKLPLSVYFTAIAVSDSVMLTMHTIMQVMKELTPNHVNFFSVAKLCSSLGYIMNSAHLISGWFVVDMAVERVLVVGFPLKAKQLTSKKKAMFAVMSQTVISVIINSFNVYMPDFSTPPCNYRPQFIWFAKVGKGLIILVGYNLLPLCITCVCYTAVVILVRTKNKQLQQQESNHARRSRERLTATCLYICLGFLIFTSPTSVFILLSRQNNWFFNMPENVRIYDTLVIFLVQFNYFSNFFIYLVSNVQFRKTLRKLLCRGSSVVEPSASGTGTGMGPTNNFTSTTAVQMK